MSYNTDMADTITWHTGFLVRTGRLKPDGGYLYMTYSQYLGMPRGANWPMVRYPWLLRLASPLVRLNNWLVRRAG